MNNTKFVDHRDFYSAARASGHNRNHRPCHKVHPHRYLATHQFWRMALIFCAVAIVGCKALVNPESEGTLLNADFEAYNEGTAVGIGSSGIPGDPSGDKIIPQGTICTGSTYRVRSNNALVGHKSLLLQYARLPHCDEVCGICEDIAIIDFVPLSPSDNDKPILLFWNGKLSNALDDTVMEITVREKDAFFSKIRLLIRRDRIDVLADNNLEKVIPHDFGTVHSIIVRVSPNAGTYGVQISGSGIVTPTTNTLDSCAFPNVVCGEFSASNFDPTALVLRMQFIGLPPSVSNVTQPEYQVDNVKIIQD